MGGSNARGGGEPPEPEREAGSTSDGPTFDDPGHPGFREDHLLTPREVAKVFRVSPKTVHRWANARVLDAVKTIGGHYRICSQSVKKWLRERGSLGL